MSCLNDKLGGPGCCRVTGFVLANPERNWVTGFVLLNPRLEKLTFPIETPERLETRLTSTKQSLATRSNRDTGAALRTQDCGSGDGYLRLPVTAASERLKRVIDVTDVRF